MSTECCSLSVALYNLINVKNLNTDIWRAIFIFIERDSALLMMVKYHSEDKFREKPRDWKVACAFFKCMYLSLLGWKAQWLRGTWDSPSVLFRTLSLLASLAGAVGGKYNFSFFKESGKLFYFVFYSYIYLRSISSSCSAGSDSLGS